MTNKSSKVYKYLCSKVLIYEILLKLKIALYLLIILKIIILYRKNILFGE